MTGSGLARFSEGSLTKEKMTQKLDWLLLPWVLAAVRPQMSAVCVGQWDTVFGTLQQTQEPWAFASTFWVPVQVSHPFLTGNSWEGSCPQMCQAFSKEGRESGIWSAAVNHPLHSSCDMWPWPPWSIDPQAPREVKLRDAVVVLFVVFFVVPGKSLIQMQYFRFCLCSFSAKVTCCVI